MPSKKTTPPLTFEEVIAQLEEVVGLLDSPQTSLDTAISLYEKGRTLMALANQKLDEAQGRIALLRPDGQETAFGEEDSL